MLFRSVLQQNCPEKVHNNSNALLSSGLLGPGLYGSRRGFKIHRVEEDHNGNRAGLVPFYENNIMFSCSIMYFHGGRAVLSVTVLL